MFWIGITGPMGSGKSTVARVLTEIGYPVVDADRVATRVLDAGGLAAAEVVAEFGPGVLASDQSIDRRALAAEVFHRPERLARLEAIIHPRVRAEVEAERERLRREGHPVAFYDVPLLFEKNMQSQFDDVVVVSAPQAIRLERLIARTGLSATEIKARWANQLPAADKERRASVVIVNDASEPELKLRTEAALSTLKLPAPRCLGGTSR